MPTEVFIDESRRANDYLIAAVPVEGNSLKAFRSTLRKMLLPGERRLHFSKETVSRRRELLDRIARQNFSATIFTCRATQNVARAHLLQAIVAEFAGTLHRLVIESRSQDDVVDQRQLVAMELDGLFPENATYEHVLPHEEPILWVADAVVWAWGAGGDWRRRVNPIVGRVIRIAP